MGGKVQLPWPDSPSPEPSAGRSACETAMTGRVQEQPVYTESAEAGDEVRISAVSR